MNNHGSPTKPPLKKLEFGAISERKLQQQQTAAVPSQAPPAGFGDQTVWPTMGQTSPHLYAAFFLSILFWVYCYVLWIRLPNAQKFEHYNTYTALWCCRIPYG